MQSARVANGCDVTKGVIIDVNSIVSGRNYDILTLIIAKLLTSPFVDLSHAADLKIVLCHVIS